MTRHLRFLGGVVKATTVLTHLPPPSPPPPPPEATIDSDFVVILAALLCALICVLGLIAVARCAWIRRLSSPPSAANEPPPSAANKGVKKKVLKTLPKLTYEDYNNSSTAAGKLSECAICLADFAAEEELRVLPQCGHAFHVSCIDTWLGSHSSCPSCRQILVVARCQKCGGFPGNSSSSNTGGEATSSSSNCNREARSKQGEDHHSNNTTFLP
ncbi:hypothetical protein ACFE04_025913 [Oxalis oulophora]